jgi:hypothetical protein
MNTEAVAVHTRTPLYIILDVGQQKAYMHNIHNIDEYIQKSSRFLQEKMRNGASPISDNFPIADVKYEYIHPSGIPMYIYAKNTSGNMIPTCIRDPMIEIGRRIIEREEAEIRKDQRHTQESLKRYMMIGTIAALAIIGLYIYLKMGVVS